MSFSRVLLSSFLVSGLCCSSVSANLLSTQSFNNVNAILTSDDITTSSVTISHGAVSSNVNNAEALSGVVPLLKFDQVDFPAVCPDGTIPVITVTYHTTDDQAWGALQVKQNFEADPSDDDVDLSYTRLDSSTTSTSVSVDVSPFAGTIADVSISFLGSDSTSQLVIEEATLC